MPVLISDVIQSFAGFLDLARKDVDVKESAPSTLLRDLHATFIKEFEGNKNGYVSLFSLE